MQKSKPTVSTNWRYITNVEAVHSPIDKAHRLHNSRL